MASPFRTLSSSRRLRPSLDYPPTPVVLLPSQRLQQFRSSPSATYPEDRHGHHFDVHVQAPLEDVDAQSRGYRADLTHESAQVSVPIPRSRDTARGHRICHSAAGLASTTPPRSQTDTSGVRGTTAGVTPLPVAMDSYRCRPRNFLNAANGDAATAPSPRIPANTKVPTSPTAYPPPLGRVFLPTLPRSPLPLPPGPCPLSDLTTHTLPRPR
ncbi:hypothetical protein B0H10DRAFT_2243555 [Mycena sp. CBHHK59/15]|nr:hypothetical protein B0H10DRAFT_2243555 [Mycena sp. CBHHK59/15]